MTIAASQLYNKNFFRRGLSGTARSAGRIVPCLVQLLSPRSIIDVGCGVGAWVREFESQGLSDFLGIDGDYVPTDLLLINRKHFKAVDLSHNFVLERSFDLVVCLEVAEHLAPSRARSFIQNLTLLGPVVVFSAAIPGQGGTDHINEQWPSYWCELFADLDYIPIDCIRPLFWNDPNVEFWYKQNIILYVSRSHLKEHPRLGSSDKVLSLVHPDLHLRVTSDLQLHSALNDIDSKAKASISMATAFSPLLPKQVYMYIEAIRYAVSNNIAGSIVEYGRWRPGNTVAILRTLLEFGIDSRDIYLLNASLERKGENSAPSDSGRENGASPSLKPQFEKVKRLAEAMGYNPDSLHYTESMRDKIACQTRREKIALFKIGLTSNNSTKLALETFFPNISQGGILVTDSYGYSQNNQAALAEYFTANKIAILLSSINNGSAIGVVTGDKLSGDREEKGN